MNTDTDGVQWGQFYQQNDNSEVNQCHLRMDRHSLQDGGFKTWFRPPQVIHKAVVEWKDVWTLWLWKGCESEAVGRRYFNSTYWNHMFIIQANPNIIKLRLILIKHSLWLINTHKMLSTHVRSVFIQYMLFIPTEHECTFIMYKHNGVKLNYLWYINVYDVCSMCISY